MHDRLLARMAVETAGTRRWQEETPWRLPGTAYNIREMARSLSHTTTTAMIRLIDQVSRLDLWDQCSCSVICEARSKAKKTEHKWNKLATRSCKLGWTWTGMDIIIILHSQGHPAKMSICSAFLIANLSIAGCPNLECCLLQAYLACAIS